jgi:hypothetical protein
VQLHFVAANTNKIMSLTLRKVVDGQHTPEAANRREILARPFLNGGFFLCYCSLLNDLFWSNSVLGISSGHFSDGNKQA